MAAYIVERHGADYEFWYVTDKIVKLRPDLIRALIPAIDFAFPLTDKAFHLLRRAVYPLEPPSLLWVHHVTTLGPAMRDALTQSDEWIVCTPEWKSEVANYCPVQVPTTVVLHGVDLTQFRRVPPQRTRLKIPENRFVVGFVGSKTSNYDEGRKGLDTFMKVLTRVRDSVPHLHVAFLGLGWDAEVAQLNASGISSNYSGYLPQSRLAEFYSSIDVYVMTSRVEGGPCTVLESMSCETPVVATRVGLVSRTIRDGENGFSVEIGDSDAIAGYIELLAHSPELCRRLGTAARATVYPDLSWPEVLSALEQPLRRMAARSRRMTDDLPFGKGEDAAKLHRAVVAIDGLLFALAGCWQGLIRFPRACKTIKASLESCTAGDVVRGIGLATKLWFRPRAPRCKK
jgi:glycosyltransferase involved in cell wall biosynthesis